MIRWIVAAGVALCIAAVGQPGGLPFTIEAVENVSAHFPGAPKLQSFAWAQWDGKWIFIGGRTTGYHGVGAADADFPRAGSNDRIWVIDPSLAKTYSFPLASLPSALTAVKDQWLSSNLLFFQDKSTLYLAGGYGANSNGKLVTYPVLSRVDLQALVKGVVAGTDTFSDTIRWTTSTLVQSAGGELLKLDDGSFYLAGGHVFTGSYRDFEAGNEQETKTASQKYLGEIRRLKLTDAGGRPYVDLIERYADPEFARRDLNAGLIILPDGHSLGAAIYGGVFTREQLNFSKPIYWDAFTSPHVDEYEQKMSAYSCATVQMFDPDSKTMYTTFFGGISRWTWDEKKSVFVQAPLVGDKTKTVYLDGMPWIDQISTLARHGGHSEEFVQSSRLGGFVGANAAFLPVAGLKRIRADAPVYDLSALRGKRTLIGYIYGGIRAFPREFPYLESSPSYSAGNVPTKPNDLILAVYITVPASRR
ncbi:MAG: hypothetical protein JO307_12430 [Bryobacterales bacterium]|nr:hypothetical protein [Bryobacterales bacterium]MBV9400634.1 hypothetical protein [Bryobacterales bacterium]